MIKKSFKINEKIYWEIFINESIKDFKGGANISYKNWEIIIEGETDIDEIFNELMNYVIYLQNEQI